MAVKLSLVAVKDPNMLSGRQNKPLAPPQLPLVNRGVVDGRLPPFVAVLGRILIVQCCGNQENLEEVKWVGRGRGTKIKSGFYL